MVAGGLMLHCRLQLFLLKFLVFVTNRNEERAMEGKNKSALVWGKIWSLPAFVPKVHLEGFSFISFRRSAERRPWQGRERCYSWLIDYQCRIPYFNMEDKSRLCWSITDKLLWHFFSFSFFVHLKRHGWTVWWSPPLSLLFFFFLPFNHN